MSSLKTVLIVDDSLTVRMDLVEAFREASFHPIACGTAQEAREVLSAQTVDLIVLDVQLPDEDGIDLLKALRGLAGTSKTPVLILSSEAEVKDRIRGLQTGANEFVGKPYDRSYIVAKARELVPDARSHGVNGRSTILVIDDSSTFREELRAALSLAGHEVLTATSGEEGLWLAATKQPDAILVDGVLPGIDGATVVRKVRLDAALRRTPCLLLTASEGRGAELRALDAGADGFVRKEETMGVILARLGSLLRGSAGAGQAGKASVSVFSPKRILAVDDSVTYLEQIGEQLRDEGYDVVMARSGEEALDLLAVQNVDCILLDVLMPGLSGQETCLRIKAAPGLRDIPLILLTAIENSETMIAGLATGADDYISKSNEFEVLKARIAAQLRRKQFEDEARQMRAELYSRELEAAEARAAREVAESRVSLVAELEWKNKELESFSYSVSHDLRAPLRAIDGFSKILGDDYEAVLDERGKDYLRRVRASAKRMGELIDDLLDLARVSRSNLNKGPVDLSSLAKVIAADLARKEPGRQVDCVIHDTPVVQGDPRLLQIVLENLLGNAWKFTGKAVLPRIEFRVETMDGETRFIVHDNGAGFDPRYAASLFRPFQRLHREADFPGTGIGLATVHRIIDRHGGRVWAEGVSGDGATFSFTLAPAPIGA